MNTPASNPSIPIGDLALLEEKRCAMRRQALAYLEEAERLDALYAAVTGTPGSGPLPVSNPNPAGGLI